VSRHPLPLELPKWLRIWAEACSKRGKSDLDSFWSPSQGRIDTLWRILSNPQIASGIARLQTQNITKLAITEFLGFACNIHKQYSSKKEFLNFSQQIDESVRLVQKSRKLAELMSSFSDYIPASTSVRYLTERVAAGDSTNFPMARLGLRKTKYQRDSEQTLPQLLEAFADDIQEQFHFLNARKDGLKKEAGTYALSNALVDLLAREVFRMTGEPSHALVACMVSDMTDVEVLESRVAKRWEARKIRP
jgi:hypothetical protein